MMRKRGVVQWLLAAAVFAAVTGPVGADIIQLKDGRSISGTMYRDGGQMIIQPDAGEKVVTTPDQVVRVTLTNSLTPGQLAEAQWNLIAAQIKKADDLAAIIALHESFLKQYPDQDISAGVRASMGEYEKLVRQKAVKFRGRWMPAAQVDVTIRTWQDEARPVVAQYRSGNVREAYEAAKQLVFGDPDNPAALTIAGMAAFRLNSLNASRLYFGKLAATDPSSPLAENNLAVICAQQRLFAEGLIHYTRALESGPGNRLLLDNIEEAMAAYLANRGDTTNNAYRDLVRQFDQAEARMEALMAQKDLYRYGSTWVSKKELTQRTDSRASLVASMKDLDAQYNNARQGFGVIGEQIAQATNDYNAALNQVNNLNIAIQTNQYGGLDVANAAVQRDAAMQNLDAIRNRKLALEAQRDQLTLAVAGMYGQADKLKVALAQADGVRFSGVQRMMELAEDQDPPPPAPVPTPPPAAAPPILQGPPPTAVVPTETPQDQVYDNYSIISTPIGLPFFPGFPARPPHQPPSDRHDQDRDHDRGNHPGHDRPANGATPPMAPAASTPSNSPAPDSTH